MVVLLVVLVGRLAWQWVTAPEPEARPSLTEQVEAIPGVVSVEAGSSRVPGAGGHRSTESVVLFDQQILDDPEDSAGRLAAVSTGWSSSHWSVDGLGSHRQRALSLAR